MNESGQKNSSTLIMHDITKQIWITSIVLIFSVVFFEWSGIDITVQDIFYNFETKEWLINRGDKLLRFVFYDGIKKVYYLFVLTILVTILFFRKNGKVKRYNRGLLIVFLSLVFVPLIVGGLKAVTNTPCAKNIVRYNGNYPYVTVLGSYPENFEQTEKMECYPAGHASGGFALLSLFFLFRNRKYRKIAVGGGMLVGWSVGAYKMMIGDHFLSHTVASMILAWLVILIISKSIFAIMHNSATAQKD